MGPSVQLQQYLTPPSIHTFMQVSTWQSTISALLSNWFCKKPPFSQIHDRVQDMLILLLLLLVDKLHSVSNQFETANRIQELTR